MHRAGGARAPDQSLRDAPRDNMLPVWIVLVLLPIFGGAERFNCRGRILGAYYADAKSGCKAFHVCVRVAGGGIRDFRFFCPPGTLFHQEAQTCTDWGDDDPLACPADLYDGQFDLYKIGSGYDTKKLSSQGSRDEEAEFGLQRAETGDRRLSQNNAASNGPASDLRAAHSSDFFSGQRDRGRDDSSQSAPQPPAPRPSSPPRQSFRRPTTPRATPASTQYTTTILPPSPQPSSPSQYDPASKRKLIRKRPVYASTAAPSTFAQNTPPQQQKQFSQQPQQQFSERPEQPFSQQPQQQFSQRSEQAFSQQAQQQFSQQPFTKKTQPTFSKQSQQQPPQHSQQQYFQQAQQQFFQPTQKTFSQQEKIVSQQPQQSFSQQQNFNQRAPQNRPATPTPAPPANVPPQYKDEYVEVSRVTPKQYNNRFYPNNPTSTPFVQSTPPQFNKKEGLAELYNYDAQSTPGLNVQNDNRPFKVRNSFSVSDIPKETDFVRTRGPPTTIDYNTAGTRSLATSTPAYKNFNSVSYEPEKNNFVSYSGTKQNYFNSPTTIPTTTIYTTTRSDPVLNLNTVAYNTNIALNTIQPANFAENQEDDGQYRPPEGEDDGQYKPELYERELLSGAHSLNIAASGNRLPEDQKKQGKSQAHIKPPSQTAAAPRPFKPAPTPPAPPTQTFRTPEPTYTTTYRPLPTTTARTSRTFDYYQTYTTTSRPNEQPAPPQLSYNFDRVRQTSTVAPRVPESTPRVLESRSQPRAPAPPTHAPQTVKPVNNKEDSSYDYAYYDSDPGFSEYDHIEEFGKTKTRT